jgi:hypothetical protein
MRDLYARPVRLKGSAISYWKQTVTVLSALGILASGACFAPRNYRPPVAPLPPGKSLNIAVTNTSRLHRVDPDEFAQELVNRLRADHLTAQLSSSGNPADATLQIEITDEEWSDSDYGRCRAHFNVTLTQAGGAVLWHRSETIEAEGFLYHKAQDGIEPWRDTTNQSTLITVLTYKFFLLFHPPR